MTRRRTPIPGIALLFAAFVSGVPLTAQWNGERVDPADSVAARRSAVGAQLRFENVRRQHLPRIDRGAVAGGRCDRRIGRFCFWYDPSSTPPNHEEDARIARARGQMLLELAELRERSPHDGWISGQLVRYLIEAGLPDSARAEAGRCAATEWWCTALGAFALHAGGRSEADSEFQRALELAPEDVQCEWSSVEILLPDRMRRDYRRRACGPERDSVEARFWWLSNPRFAMQSNELRAEHYARRTMARIQDGGRNPYSMRWGDDMEELVVRYGWSRRYTRGFPRPGEVSSPVTGHEPAPSFYFVPDDAAFGEPLDVHDELWDLTRASAPSRYAPRWATRIDPLDAQITSFRRGDSALILAAFSVPRALAASGWRAELGASGGPYAAGVAASGIDSSTLGVLSAVTPLEPLFVGVDVIRSGADSLSLTRTERDTVLAARTRLTLSPPGSGGDRFAVSAALLLAPAGTAADDTGGPPDVTLDSVLPRVLGGSTVAAPGSVGIFWEIYGLPAGRTPLRMTLVLRGGERGWLRRLGDRVTGRTVAEPPLLAWTDLAHVPDEPDDAVVGRSVRIELPALAPGSYALEIRAVLPDGRDAQSVRLLEVRRE